MTQYFENLFRFPAGLDGRFSVYWWAGFSIGGNKASLTSDLNFATSSWHASAKVDSAAPYIPNIEEKHD